MTSNRLQRAALILLVAALPTLAGAAESSPAPEPAKVMVMGVFHFANPGRDMVKSGVIDVMTNDNQAYLDGLATRLATFQPTDILVECDPSDQARFDKNFDGYKKGTFALKSNEIYQIGFKVAKAARVDKITCFDEGNVGWDAEPMFNYIKANDPQMQASMDAMYKSLSERSGREQSTLSLPQLLQLSNDAERDRENKDLYIRTNDVDAGGSFAGADASASWWHRNFRMYANVQKAATPGHRVLVVAGSGHTAILKDLLAIDSQRQSEDVSGYLVP
ncbi:DUF5694 domain-containing protein [Lysobacter sp. A378]